jgi:hypothetical protein
MNLRVLGLPENPDELAPWLDRHLVGSDLAALVAELEAVHSGAAGGSAPGLDSIRSDQLSDVLQRGLRVLPRSTLGLLLRNPRLLLEIQEQVLIQGGPYWQDLSRRNPRVARHVAKTWSGIERQLLPSVAGGRNGPEVLKLEPVPSGAATHLRLVRIWATLATVAASIMAILFVADRMANAPVPVPVAGPEVPRPDRASWGWNRPGVIAKAEPPADYLNHLADAAGEWFDQRPATSDDLARRLGELRTGCTRLILAEHTGLSPDDRAWLVERCRAWSAKLDDAIHALEGGTPFEQVRADADGIVNRLTSALRDRAKLAA